VEAAHEVKTAKPKKLDTLVSVTREINVIPEHTYNKKALS